MPQLSIETFVTQYFWLTVLLLVLYNINTTIIIPRISLIQKAREIGVESSWSEGGDNLRLKSKAPEYKRRELIVQRWWEI